MSYQQDIFSLISSIIGQNNNIVLPVEIIKFTGDYHTAALLSQLIYWQGKQKDPEDWIYKTYDQWEAEIVLSKYQTSRSAKALVKMGILETKVARVRLDNGMLGDRAVHYRLKHDEFVKKFTEHLSILESKETSLSKVKKLHFPKSSNSTNLSINTETTSKDYDNVTAPPEAKPNPVQESKKEKPSSFSKSQFITMLATLMTLIPEHHQQQSVKKTIEKGLGIHTKEYIKTAILYTIAHSNGDTTAKFKAYLGKCIENHWHNGWTPEQDEADQQAIVNEFRNMSDEVLNMLAGAGNQFATDELARRKK